MSRRNDTPVPEYRHAKAKQKAATPTTLLTPAPHEPRPPEPGPAGTPPPSSIPEPLQPAQAQELSSTAPVKPNLGRFATRAELDAVMLKFKNDGVCPLCQVKIGRGIYGHVSKCLRLQNSRLESTTTS